MRGVIPMLVVAGMPRWTCSFSLAPRDAAVVAPPPPPPPPPVLAPRTEHVAQRERMTPDPPPPRPRSMMKIADQTVVHALELGRPGFLHCFHRAQHDDPSLVSLKINVHLVVDASGAVTAAQTDVTDPKLATCVVNVAKRLQFPLLDAPAVADLTFLAS
jgi:hypothetical protein